MATKTITIMKDAYNILLENKLENESFSDEIRRIASKRTTKKLSDFFGILPDKEGEGILKDLEKIRSANIRLIKKRAK